MTNTLAQQGDFKTASRMTGIAFLFVFLAVVVFVFNLYNVYTMYTPPEPASEAFKAYGSTMLILFFIGGICMVLAFMMTCFALASSKASDFIASFVVALIGVLITLFGCGAAMYLFNTNILHSV